MRAKNFQRKLVSAAKQSWKKAKPYVKKGWEKARPYAKKAGKMALAAGADAAKGYVTKKTSKGDTKSQVLKTVANTAIDKGSAYASSKLN